MFGFNDAPVASVIRRRLTLLGGTRGTKSTDSEAAPEQDSTTCMAVRSVCTERERESRQQRAGSCSASSLGGSSAAVSSGTTPGDSTIRLRMCSSLELREAYTCAAEVRRCHQSDSGSAWLMNP